MVESNADKREPLSSGPTIEYFGAERGAAVGSEDVVFLAIVRNRTNTPIAAGQFRLWCYAVNGLDYTSGETMPILPILAPNQALAYRWRLSVSAGRQTLMAAALLQRVPITTRSAGSNGNNPGVGASVILPEPEAEGTSDVSSIQTTIAVVPRVSRMPGDTAISIKPGDAPNASAGPNSAAISNDLISLRIMHADRKQSVFSLAARKGTDWSELATGISLGAILSAEEGQTPWWEAFRWKEAHAANEKDLASLILTGTFGNRWRAEMTLETHRFSSAINVRMRMVALRTLRCKGFKLPEMLAERDHKTVTTLRADGSPIFCENDSSLLSESRQLSAVRRDAVTFGMTWSNTAFLQGFEWNPLPVQDPQLITVLGGTSSASDAGEVILSGASIDINFRIFAFTPSSTIKDAIKFVQP